MVCQLHIIVQIQLNLLWIKCLLCLTTPQRTELGGAAIRISVRRSDPVSVDVVIAKSPIRRHLHTSMFFKDF